MKIAKASIHYSSKNYFKYHKSHCCATINEDIYYYIETTSSWIDSLYAMIIDSAARQIGDACESSIFVRGVM